MTTVMPEPAPVPSPIPVTPPPTKPTTSPAPRTWMRKITGGGQIVESCPAGCTDSHDGDLSGDLDDLQHGADFEGVPVEVPDAVWGSLGMPVLAGRLNVSPYSEFPERRVPHVLLVPWEDVVSEALSPDEFAAVIANLRAHCDALDAVHARLVQAVAEHGHLG